MQPTLARYLRGAPGRYRGSSPARRYGRRVIPLPRAWALTSAMLVGVAVGMLGSVAAVLVVDASIRRPDIVVALVLGVPSAIGLVLIGFSTRRWMTTLGAFVLAVAPGWFGMLVAMQLVMYG